MSEQAILCVDDEAIILLAMKQELKRRLGQRYSIETALDAAEALSVIAELETRGIETVLVISDWFMPGLRGDQFLVELHAKRPSIKAILITGQADEESVNRAIAEAGLCACIHKPWRAEELTALIKRCLADTAGACEVD